MVVGGGGRAGGRTGAAPRDPVGGPGGGRGLAGPEGHHFGRPVGRSGAAVAAPVLGTGLYLGWVWSQFGDPWLPFRVQQQLGHRGAVVFPLTAMWHNLTSVAHGHHLGSGLHVPWVVLSVALVVVAFRRLPRSYALFAASVLIVSLTSANLDSFERYALGAFPLVVAASTLTSRRGIEAVVLALAGLGMAGYAMLAFVGVSVP